MARKDLLVMYGHVGLIWAVFVLIGGLVAAPLLERIWFPLQILAEHF
jgi:hypothetical protein